MPRLWIPDRVRDDEEEEGPLPTTPRHSREGGNPYAQRLNGERRVYGSRITSGMTKKRNGGSPPKFRHPDEGQDPDTRRPIWQRRASGSRTGFGMTKEATGRRPPNTDVPQVPLRLRRLGTAPVLDHPAIASGALRPRLTISLLSAFT